VITTNMPIDQNKVDGLLNNQPLSFQDALHLMTLGYKMKRSDHKDIRYITVQKPDENSKMRKGYLYAVFTDGQAVPYNLQNADIFSSKWIKAE